MSFAVVFKPQKQLKLKPYIIMKFNCAMENNETRKNVL